MPSWGDLNACLNRLVREGVISGFRTNLAARSDPASLVITVSPGRAARLPPAGVSAAVALRARVALALAKIAPGAAITVEAELEHLSPTQLS